MLILGIIASSITGNLVTTSYESIATVTVGGAGTSTFDFTSIPSTYKHLQLRIICKSSGGSQVSLRFNSDTASNYSEHQLVGDGSSATAYGGANTSLAPQGQTATTSNTFGAFIIDILDYGSTSKYKTVRGLNGADMNGSGQIGLYSNLWRSTSAITDITVLADSGKSFDQYSSFALYGIKGS
jgi:hypothetical protein